MITITEQKPVEEIMKSLEKSQSVYIIGCGACATMLHTGGKSEVLAMKEQLEEAGKKVTGWMVIPTACDRLTEAALTETAGASGVSVKTIISGSPCQWNSLNSSRVMSSSPCQWNYL